MKRTICAVRFFDFLEHGLEAVFELAAILRAGQHRAEVERDDALVAQALRHVAGDDAARESFDDGGFANAGLANQHGIVLGAAAQHLDDAANLLVAADHRIELAAARQFGQILGVFFQRLELAFGILVGDALRAAHGGQRLQNGFVRGADCDQRIARRRRPSECATPSSRCSVETYSSLKLAASLKAWSRTLVQRLAQARAARPLPPREAVSPRSRAGRCSSRSVGTPIFSSTAGMTPSRSSSSASNRWTGCISGLPSSAARACACCDRLLRLDGEFFPTNSH